MTNYMIQAHMMARFSILRCFLDAGKEFASLDYTKDNLSDLTVKIDRSKIISHGRPAVEKYLQKIQVYKATADLENGTKLYDDTTHVDKFFADKVRPIVLAKKVPRKVFCQANTVIEGDKVILKEYDPSPAGLIQSYAERSYI
jgi:dipeptidyl-peptidase-3